VEQIKNRFRYPAILLKQLVKTDFKLRYQGSVLGYVWSLLRPLLLFIILYIVFARFLRVGEGVPNFPIYLLLGIVFWNFFVEVTNGSVSAIVGKGDLIRKINFPKYIIILAGSISALINLFLNFIIIGVFMWALDVPVSVGAIFLMPFVIVEMFVFSLALGFFLSAAFVRFRDVSYIWEVILQGAFYATPILYPLSLIPDSAARLLILNPMAQIIQDARYLLVTTEAETIASVYGTRNARLIPLAVVLLVAVVATIYFRKRSAYFAEEV
jgi:ABC-2 type transport system permease protein